MSNRKDKEELLRGKRWIKIDRSIEIADDFCFHHPCRLVIEAGEIHEATDHQVLSWSPVGERGGRVGELMVFFVPKYYHFHAYSNSELYLQHHINIQLLDGESK